MTATSHKKAAIYLRVSSTGQVKTDYDPEGLSLPAQREACERKAAQLGAVVVREYVEPGVSGGSLLKRKAFRKMIQEVDELRDVDYVIVWSVSRWARDQEDHWTARGLITRAGAKLISVKEPIGEDTAHGIMLEGVMAAVAASRRIEIADDVKRGIQRKVEVGGTHSRAPLGYLNVREPLPEGGEVRTVALDPQRAPLIRTAFDLYATGDYSLSELAAILEQRGLRNRPIRGRPAQPLGMNRLSTILRNDYYLGTVRHNGKPYTGRHEPLVDEKTYEQVQILLASQRQNAARAWIHHHYLRGSLYCGECDGRLFYSRSRGKLGTLYEYYVCPGKKAHTCGQPHHRLEALETAVEAYYTRIHITEQRTDAVRDEIRAHLEEISGISSAEIAEARSDLTRVNTEERKLLQAHYKDTISQELFEDELARIRKERVAAEHLIEKLNISYDIVAETLNLAFEQTEDIDQLYRICEPTERRLINQSVFKKLLVDREEIVGHVFAEPFAALHDEQTAPETPQNIQPVPACPVPNDPGRAADAGQQRPRNAKTPVLSMKDRGWSFAKMVPLRGFEPRFPP